MTTPHTVQHVVCPECQIRFERKVVGRSGGIRGFRCPAGHISLRPLARQIPTTMDKIVTTEILEHECETPEERMGRLMRESRRRVMERRQNAKMQRYG